MHHHKEPNRSRIVRRSGLIALTFATLAACGGSDDPITYSMISSSTSGDPVTVSTLSTTGTNYGLTHEEVAAGFEPDFDN